MPKLAANLSMLYPELDFLDRFAAAAADGFVGVEFLFPYDYDAAALSAQLSEHGLTQVLFNVPPGDAAAGERGLACLPGREPDFAASISRALGYAWTLACPRLHVMAGLLPRGATRDDVRATYVRNMRVAARLAADAGVDVLIEPINLRDVPGYFLNRQDDAHALVEEIGEPNVKVQFDLYHAQIVEGDLTTALQRYLPSGRVGHMQVAGVPKRNEPDRSEIDVGFLFDRIDEIGYEGWIGCEYRPARGSEPGGTSAGLSWARRWLRNEPKP